MPTRTPIAGGPSAGQSAIGNLKSAIAVFFVCLVVYHANGRSHPEVDCVTPPYTAWSLLRHGSFDLRAYDELMRYRGTEVLELADGRCVSYRPPGAALAVLPVLAPFAFFREQPPTLGNMMHLGKLVAASSVAGAAVLFFLLCRRVAPAASWPATILFALGSSLWSTASQALWMHGPATFWLGLALYLLLPEGNLRSGRATVAGLALGLAILTRPTTVFFALMSGLALLAARRWRAAGALACGGAGPVLGLCLLNLDFFGQPIAGGGYSTNCWERPLPLWLSASALLLAPSRGLLIYSPALLLVPLGAVRQKVARVCERALRSVSLAWLGATVLTLLCYARWPCWWGGWCYGPRFFCETMPACCLLFALGYQALRSAWQRWLAVALVGLSVLVHLAGVAGHSAHVDWHDRHAPFDRGRKFLVLTDTQIEAHARAVLRKVVGSP